MDTTATPRGRVRYVMVPLAPGDAIDRITVLEIKVRRLGNTAKLNSTQKELAAFQSEVRAAIGERPEVKALAALLAEVNEALWQSENEIRRLERASDLGIRFVAVARRICELNDRRSSIKQEINSLLGAAFAEHKQYE